MPSTTLNNRTGENVKVFFNRFDNDINDIAEQARDYETEEGTAGQGAIGKEGELPVAPRVEEKSSQRIHIRLPYTSSSLHAIFASARNSRVYTPFSRLRDVLSRCCTPS